MSIKTRLSIALVAVVALFCLLQHVALDVLVRPSFEELELTDAEQDAARVRAALQDEVEALRAVGQDAAVWEHASRALRGEQPLSDAADVHASICEHLRLALACVVDARGRVLLRADRAPEGRAATPPAPLDADALPQDAPLLRPLHGARMVQGFAGGAWGPLLVVSLPIRGRGDEVVGVLVLARELDDAVLDTLRRRTRLELDLAALDDPGTRPEALALASSLAADGTTSWAPASQDELVGSALLRDVTGEPTLLLTTRVPRTMSAQGRTAIQSALLATAGTGVALLAVLYALLHFGVVGPLSRFTRHALQMGALDEIVPRLDLQRSDEIGQLSRRFAELLQQLDAYHGQLAEASHRAGMSQVATNVLHDVGNMVNSVGVSAALLREATQRIPADELAALARALRREDLARWVAEDAGGRQLPRLVELLAARLEEERSALQGESARLASRVQDVVAVIRAQQELAGGRAAPTRVAVAELVQRAIEVVAPARHGVTVAVHGPDDLCAALQRPKVLQILVNLVQNAVDAFEGLPEAGRRVDVRFGVRRDRLRIEVTDTACGIAAEDLERIFRHGMTTKENGHGFGLHSSANLATEMGGALSAHSDGPGRGSTFVLELPVEARTVEPAAPLPARAATEPVC